MRGAAVTDDVVHPFRKNFDELKVGDSLLTPRRTITESDVSAFAGLSGDRFYAHTDEIAARGQLVRQAGGARVSGAGGSGGPVRRPPAWGPVLANYGLEGLRFTEPVGFGDTIRARLTVQSKTAKDTREGETPTGVVKWHVDVTNQNDVLVATYSILTLVARGEGQL